MVDISYSIVEARARLGAIAREVCATREPVAITDHGRTVAVLVSPADALELEEARALAAHRERQARGEDAGVPHEEAYRRIFGEGGAFRQDRPRRGETGLRGRRPPRR
ncbi:type II toxin-antitoxin system Phd/YefM family antitoxin [Streptomyces radicis]|uniref:Antitoxin n=1 Tax=Streptomyces radicis TaxID=1750517 RepID=A0A3A9W9M9_9ACTN|nr:type II toxin-antitoxin system Phd/YefM family antitoxin [Streptomyces radicis]RKN09590.1 type II toxin-antitoxin system Phd/YefM family antitoxin [Streptomyces radicis]RKN23269.1 type II toxin-antitoxin system Phd/YefM family antitoxin [Streptomyces radicis]